MNALYVSVTMREAEDIAINKAGKVCSPVVLMCIRVVKDN